MNSADKSTTKDMNPQREELRILSKQFIDGKLEPQDLVAAISNLKESPVLTADVKIPKREHLQISLVPSTYVERTDEYRDDETTWRTYSGIFFGAILGILVNLVTGGQMKTETWLVVVVFGLMAGLTLAFALQANHRRTKLRKELLDSEQFDSSTIGSTKDLSP